MSRSYRKNPYVTDQQGLRHGGSKKAKRDANRAVRAEARRPDENSNLTNGKNYRKISCSWNIRDWSFYAPKERKARNK